MTAQISLTADILLFDMDGTLLDATGTIERIWTAWAGRHGVDPEKLLVESRGQRVADTVRTFAGPNADIEAEERWLSEQAHLEPLAPSALPGAISLLQALPPGRWAIVTSAERDLALHWLERAGIPLPNVLISANDVSHGKPDPSGYLLAAARLGHAIDRAIVFEDSAAGVKAGRAAAAKVVGIANKALVSNADVEFWMPDFSSLGLHIEAGQDRLVVYQK